MKLGGGQAAEFERLERLLWLGRRSALRIGWHGLLGAALIVGSLVALPVWLRPMWQDAEATKAQAKTLREHFGAHPTLERHDDPAAQLTAFYTTFPGSDSLADTLQKIYVAAAENNIALNQGDYTLAPAEGGILQRYEVVFPVRGKYPQVRNFIARVLAENGQVALLGVSLARNTATDIGVEAQLRFGVYVKDAP